MTNAPERATVLDTSVLSNFAHVDRTDLLLELPRPVTVPAVRAELAAGTETYSHLERALSVLGTTLPVVDPGEAARARERQLLETLDPGEAQALAVAVVTDGTFVSDDGDARTVAGRHGVDVTGSIGLLVRFVEARSISDDDADTALKRWIDEAGFRSPARDIDVFLDGGV